MNWLQNLELQIPMRGNRDSDYNIQLVRIGLVSKVDWEHGSKVDNIASVPTTYPMTQAGYNAVFAMYKENEHCSPLMYV